MIPTFLWRRFREPLPVLLFPPRLTWCTEATTAEKASLVGNFVIAQGQVTLPGPIVVIFYGSVQVNMDITFNTSSKYETAEGTCTGNVSFVSGIQDGEGAIVAGNPWAGTDGTVFYYPTGN